MYSSVANHRNYLDSSNLSLPLNINNSTARLRKYQRRQTDMTLYTDRRAPIDLQRDTRFVSQLLMNYSSSLQSMSDLVQEMLNRSKLELGVTWIMSTVECDRQVRHVDIANDDLETNLSHCKCKLHSRSVTCLPMTTVQAMCDIAWQLPRKSLTSLTVTTEQDICDIASDNPLWNLWHCSDNSVWKLWWQQWQLGMTPLTLSVTFGDNPIGHNMWHIFISIYCDNLVVNLWHWLSQFRSKYRCDIDKSVTNWEGICDIVYCQW